MYRTAAAAALLCLALGLASCGGGSGSEGTSAALSTHGVPTSPASGGAVVDPGGGTGSPGDHPDADGGSSGALAGSEGGHAGSAGAHVRSGAGHAEASGGCTEQLGNFLDRMDDLRHALLAGLSYSEYVVRVRAIGDAYESVPVDRLGAACLAGEAARAEDAFNQYLRAANTWGGCAATAGCAASEIEGRLQHRWHLASKSLDAAERRG